MMFYIYVWKLLEVREMPLCAVMSLFIWNPVVTAIMMYCQKCDRIVYQRKTLNFTIHLIYLCHTVWFRKVVACGLLSLHEPGLTGTSWSLWAWCISRQTLVWSATCWRTWWRCVEEFSIHFEACSYGTTCCSAHAMCCQMLPSKRMSQKAPYVHAFI